MENSETDSCQLPVRFPKELFALSNSSMKETSAGLCWYANHEAAKTPVLIDNPHKQLQLKIDGDFIGLIIRLGWSKLCETLSEMLPSLAQITDGSSAPCSVELCTFWIQTMRHLIHLHYSSIQLNQKNNPFKELVKFGCSLRCIMSI